MRTALTERGEKWKDRGLAALFVIGLWMFLAVFFDFYYDLNDDTAMKDILSGTYTGVPDGHCIQMLYPLGWCISLFYKMLPMIPWYGIFLCGCQFLALWVCLCSLLPKVARTEKKASWLLLLTVGAGILFLYEWIFVQYTVTAGLLVIAAIVRLMAGPDAGMSGFFRYHSVTAFLAVLAFFLRTEMMLLFCPFAVLAVCWRVFPEWKRNNKDRSIFLKYGVLGMVVLAFMGMGVLADKAAYSSPQWQQFRQFFDDRTSVYDFYGIPDYEIHKEFYEEIGLSEESYELLKNYNFELDQDIDAAQMQKIAAYAAEHQEQSMLRRLYLSVYTYVYRFLHGQELIFDLLLVVSYFFLGKAAFKNRNPQLLGKLMLLFGTRTAIWLFLLYRGRVPERITHPLYLAEFVMLALFFLLDADALQWKKYEKSAILSLYMLLFLCTALEHVQMTKDQYETREAVNEQWQEWKAYCLENPEPFYYLDVYSSVAYSEKMFSDTASDYRNFDLLGGWCSKSPIASQKQAVRGIESAEEGFLTGQALFVTDAAKLERSPEFLISWYGEKGKQVSVTEMDKCGTFSIFRIGEDTVD